MLGTRKGWLAAAGSSGLILGLAFPPFCQAWAAFVGLIPLLHVVALRSAGGRRSQASLKGFFAIGWWFGFVFFLFLLNWIANLTTERMTYPVLRWPAAVVAAAYLACYPALFALGQGFLCRRLPRYGMWFAPFAWTLAEVARSEGTLGFPWGALGYGLLPHASLIQGASVGGVDLLSFWIVCVNIAVWEFLKGLRGSRRSLGFAGVVVSAFLIVPWVWGRARIPEGPSPRMGRVGIVQPSARGDDKWDPANRDASFHVLEAATRRLAKRGVDFIVWPETAVPLYLRYDPEYYGRVRALASGVARPLVAGFPDASRNEDGRILKYNAAGLVDETGVLTRVYWKIHLVPFGEALPWQDVFPFLEKIDLGEGDYSPGREFTVFSSPIGRFSVLICFESIFPRLARRFVDEGAEFIVNITNDDWFGDTPAAAQHAAMAVLRAVENGVSVVRCANSGISGVVDPYGRIEKRTPLFERVELAATVGAPLGGTLYRRTGNAFLWVCGVVLAVSLGTAARRSA